MAARKPNVRIHDLVPQDEFAGAFREADEQVDELRAMLDEDVAAR
jgi:hypothetical protein